MSTDTRWGAKVVVQQLLHKLPSIEQIERELTAKDTSTQEETE